MCPVCNDTPNRPRTIHYPSNHWILSLKWVDGNVRARPSWWEGGQPNTPYTKCQVRSKQCKRPTPTSSIQYTAELITWGLFTSAHEGRMAYVRARPHRGMGGTRPPPTPSAVTPRYDTPVSHMCPSIESWLNKQAVFADHACLSGKNLTCIL